MNIIYCSFNIFLFPFTGVPIQLPNLDMFVKEDSSILVIKEINADATDTYSCVASSIAGQDSAATKITVLPPGKDLMM